MCNSQLTPEDVTVLLQTAERKKLTSNDPFGASSKRTSLVCEHGGCRYKLRKCFSKEDASRMAARLSQVAHLGFFPGLVGQSDNWLFFEFINIPEAKRDQDVVFWGKVGSMIAELEKVPSPLVDVNFSGECEGEGCLREYIEKAAVSLADAEWLDWTEVSRLHRIVADFEPHQYCFGYLDLLAGNLLYNGGPVIIADEEGLAGCIPGISMIRPLDIWHQYKPSRGLHMDECQWMLAGYSKSGGDADLFIKKEKQLRAIYYVLKVYDSVKFSGTTAESLKRLREALTHQV